MLQMHVTLFCASECSLWCVDYARRSCSCDLNMSFYARFSANGALPQLETLLLSRNEIGDIGISALASACASGALPQLNRLVLSENAIGDVGLSSLAAAVGNGALASLDTLDLSENEIGEAGMTAFADAVGKGALASLKKIVVDTKHERHPQLVAACQPRGIEIA